MLKTNLSNDRQHASAHGQRERRLDQLDRHAARADTPKLAWDSKHELGKANPLADWSDDDCWAFIKERGLPYNKLHDQGYASIGDTHSTFPGEGRAGRWAGTGRTECGLHT